MFTKQLTIFPVRSKSPKIQSINHKTHSQTQDLHFQICSSFLKKVGQKLLFRQAEIISDSSHFVNNFQLNFDLTKKDVFGLSTNYSEWSPDSQFSQEIQARMIMRRNTSRRSENSVQQALKQVKQQCSLLTFEVLSNLATQYVKTQTKIQGLETKQYIIHKKQEAADKYHQQNIILKKQLETQQSKVRKLQDEINSWKAKNDQILRSFEQKANPLMMNKKLIEINQKVYRDVKSFLQDKETHINSRLRKIQNIEDSILKKIQDIFYDPSQGENILESQNQISQIKSLQNLNSCQKCCSMIKRIKNSILDYRDYLQNQAQEVNNLYQKHKNTMFYTNQKQITSNKSLA